MGKNWYWRQTPGWVAGSSGNLTRILLLLNVLSQIRVEARSVLPGPMRYRRQGWDAERFLQASIAPENRKWVTWSEKTPRWQISGLSVAPNHPAGSSNAINGGGMAKRIPAGCSECWIANCQREYSTARAKYFHTMPLPKVGVVLFLC